MDESPPVLTMAAIEQALEAWERDGRCEALCEHGCLVEADAHCPHDRPSILLVAGLV